MIVIFGLLVIGALSASAQDEEAPNVVGPVDRPGADVIWKENAEYTLDATGSRDNVGITNYTWTITAPDDTETVIINTSSQAKWTPTSPGIYKILTMAEDAEGNKGYHIFAMDVVEVIPAQMIQNSDVSYDHSIAVTGGTLEYRNANIEVTGGKKGEGVTISRGEMLTEGITYRGVGGSGALAGYWAPYNTGGRYGDVYEDPDNVLTGKVSIRNSGGSYHYGYMYYFDSPEDLSDYNGLVFWLKTQYTYGRFYYLYMYSGSGYGYRYYYTGGQEMSRGWWGHFLDMDINNVGRGYDYGIDITAVTSIRFYCYGSSGNVWIDCAYFDKTPRGDNITESATPSGDWAGYWSGFSTSSHSYVGSSSVYKTSGSGYQNFYYYFNQPTDLSIFDALKLYTYYSYYYAYTYNVYFYDSNGRYQRFYPQGSYTYFHYYATYYHSRWHCVNLPFHDNPQYTQSGFDESQVTRMRFYIYFPSSRTIHLDGLEFHKSQGAGAAGPPSLAENIPHGIYALEDGELKMTNSAFTSPESWGAFVHCENKLEIKATSFDGLWGTQHPSIKNEGQTYGGVLAFNAPSVRIEDVTITKAASSGFYIENSNLYAKNLDLSGVAKTFGGSAGLITAFQGTAMGQKNQVTIENCDFHDSPTGSGLSVLSQDALGDATVDIDDVSAYKNGIYGIAIEIVGWTGNLTVSVSNSDLEENGGSGFAFVAHDSKPAAGTDVKFKVEDCNALENNGYGFLFVAEKADVGTYGELIGLESYDNSGSGIGFDINRMAGRMDLYFEDVYTHDNTANGIHFLMQQARFKDMSGQVRQGAGVLNVELESCVISSNEGHGVFDENTANAGSNDALRPTIKPIVTGKNLTVEKNEGHGWYVTPRGRPQYAQRDAYYNFYDSVFSDNDGNGFYIYEYYYNYYEYGYTKEHYYFDNCSFTYNTRGLEQYWYSASYGTESWVEITGCTFQDNNYETIKTHCYWYTYYDTGQSYMGGAEYDIRDSLLDGFVSLDLSGAYDYGRDQNVIKAILIGNTYTSDQPMFIRLGQYYYGYQPLDGTIIYKDNTHTSPSTSDGLRFQMYGGRYLEGTVEIEDQEIPDALGNGIYVRFGTTYRYSAQQSVTGRVTLNNVNIVNPLEDGLFVETWHRYPSGSQSDGFYSIVNSKITGVGTGVRAAFFDGEIRNCVFSNIREQTIYTHFGVVDVYESEIGEISETNLRVDEKGAIRLWFDLRIYVVWRDEPTQAVHGTTVEIKDNSWNILGINTIDDDKGILFTNLNSYSVLPEGIFTRNPYIVTADYIGIVKEKHVEIAENTAVTIYMVDDVSPRLTLESPKDGSEQREQEVLVKGTVYDKHTGVDRVEVSLDGTTWWEATLDSERFTYTYTLTDIPQGLVLLRVRGFDMAGNSESTVVSILVDSTPPDLDVITPTDGMRTNKRLLEIVGTTDVGALVYINDQKVEIQYTLISHQIVLAEGPNAIKVASLDYLGNINEVVRYVTLDTQAPYIALVNIEDGDKVRTSKLHIVGLTDTEDVTISIGGTVIAVDEEGRFETDVMLVEGPNDIEIYGKDSTGNDRLIVITVTLDQSEPWLKLVEPSMKTLTEKDITVSGFVEMDTRVFVNEREVDVSFGYFETTVSAKEGDFILTVTAQDVAGNEHTIEVPLLIDTIAPALDVIFPTEGYVTNVETLEVRGSIIGTENEDSRFLELYINDVPRLFDFNSGDFAQELLLEEGVNRIRVEGFDPAGNMATLTRTVMLDSKAPYLNVVVGNTRTDPNWNEPVSLSDFVYVYGYTEIGSALTINGVSVEVDSETGYFNYSLDLPPPASGLKISTTDIVVISLDEAGNSVTTVKQVNRLEGVDTKVEEEASTAEWLILILALVIFGLSFMGAVAYQRIQYQEDVIESYEHQPAGATVTAEGAVVATPPARPARGGRARQKPRTPESDEVEIELDEEEV